ncbi:MAG: DUF2283 domain-containing protein [bacterium]
MEKIKLFTKKKKLDWDYDEEADVLYLSFGRPQEAVGIDMGEGMILRYSEKLGEIVGLTIFGIREHLFKEIKN